MHAIDRHTLRLVDRRGIAVIDIGIVLQIEGYRSPIVEHHCHARWRDRQKLGRAGTYVALPSFSRRSGSKEAVCQVRAALRRAKGARCRLLAARARSDARAWVVKRRERTRQLIELGGLVAKAGIVELVDDDRAVNLPGAAPGRGESPE